jgi:hypothetical protein
LLLLAGCSYLEPPPPPPAPLAKPAPAPPTQAALPPVAPPAPPRPSRKPVPPPGLAPAAPDQPGSDARGGVAVTPEALRGMRPEEVLGALGDPWQRAESAPATVWRYVTRTCELDLYFYLDLQSKVTRVLDLDFRPADFGGERCLEQLAAERRAREGASAGASGPR